MTVVVREATPADAPELARLRWDSRPGSQAASTRAEFMRRCDAWLREAMASGRWTMAVAECGPDALCGCMFLQEVDKVPAPGSVQRRWGYVTNAFVDALRRNSGIGGRLLGLLIERSRHRGLEFLVVWPSDESVPFYQRAGFRPASDVHAGSGDVPPFELMLGSRS